MGRRVYINNAYKEASKRKQRVKKYSKLLNKVSEAILQEDSYFRRLDTTKLSKQKVLDNKKRMRKHNHNKAMAKFYEKKIRVNNY